MKKLLGVLVAAMFFTTAVLGQVPEQQESQQPPPSAPPLPPQNQQNTYPQQNNNKQHVLPQGNQNTFPQNQNVVPPPSDIDTTIHPRSNPVDSGFNAQPSPMDTTGAGGTDTSGTYNPPRL